MGEQIFTRRVKSIPSVTPSYMLNGIPVLGYYPVEHFDALIRSLDR